MTKLELNDKLAELSGIDRMHKRICEVDMKEGIIYTDDLLIDDWTRLMDLAVDNRLHTDIFDEFTLIFCLSSKDNRMHHEENKKHESPYAATRFAIAMALVKLKEDK